MDRALQLAEAGWGRVHPNPLVGAVVVRDGRIVGEGWHAEFGGPHAEVAALAGARGLAAGATLYVTLEPCAHRGKTPPCTDAILAAGIERVVFGANDPTPAAAGGAGVLASAGVRVERGLAAAEVRRLDPAFFHVHEHHRPYVALKLAVSLDGRLSRRTGERTALTGPLANEWVHRLRAGFDAIMVGRVTLDVDDPELTARGDPRPRVPPARVVLDSNAQVTPDRRLFRASGGGPVWIVTAADADERRCAALREAGARVLQVRRTPGGLDIDAALNGLWREGLRSILCEGGGRVAAALIAAGAVQRLHLWVAPVLFGADGPPAFPLERRSEGWTLVETRPLGDDVLIVLDHSAQPSD